MAARFTCPYPDCRQPVSVDAKAEARSIVCSSCGRTIPAEVLAVARSTAPTEAPSLPPPSSQQELGEVGRFRLLERVGSGSFGVVYRAYDPVMKREVALKVARADAHDDPEMIERFLREPRAAAELFHPSIVPVHDTGRDGNRYWIASGFVRGRTLAAEIETARERGGFDLRRAAVIVRQLAEALAYAHRERVIHRDVKPSNVMMDEKGQPLLMDFGLAARRDADVKITQDGVILGTPEYMAPEQWHGRAEAASDQSSLGVILYELLTGRLPFDGMLELLAVKHVREDPPPLRRVRHDLPRDLEAICLKSVEKVPGRRYGTIGQLADDLQRWLDGEPTHARPLGFVERGRKWVRKNPSVASLIATIATVVLVAATVATALGVYAILESQRANQEEIQRKEKEAAAEREGTLRQKADTEREIADEERRKAEAAEQKNARFLMGSQVQLVASKYQHDPGQAKSLLHDLDACPISLRDAAWRYHERDLSRWELGILQDHTGHVSAVAFSPDGLTLVSGSGDMMSQQNPILGQVRVWDVKTGRVKATFDHPGGVRAMAFSPDGLELASGSRDGTVRLWDATDWRHRVTLQGHSRRSPP